MAPTPPRLDAAGTASHDASAGNATPTPRITLGMQSISDVVFGLALSIGSVILIARLPPDPGTLVTDVLFFGFNFLIVIIVWTGYRRAVVTLPHETQATVVVNLALLFTVSIEPFLFWVMAAGGTMLEPASVGYALDVGSMILLQSSLNTLLLAEEKASPRSAVPPILLARIRRRMWQGVAIGLLFWASALPVFWIPLAFNSTLRIDLWYFALALILLLPRLSRSERGRLRKPQTG